MVKTPAFSARKGHDVIAQGIALVCGRTLRPGRAAFCALKGHDVIAQGNALGTGHHLSVPCKGFIGLPPEMEPFQGMAARTSTTQGAALGDHMAPFQGGRNHQGGRSHRFTCHPLDAAHRPLRTAFKAAGAIAWRAAEAEENRP